MDSSKKLTLFLRAMPMLPKHSLWSTLTEINGNSPTGKPLGEVALMPVWKLYFLYG
ncbi:hypothetical protein [Neobacillus sp.]|uniref:hypothetical protein n=1 Tax=Neobacillus sp. TaxID=2675273 RepID=UPI00289D2BC0|nr:hypothetical protein [Neobacillus sp.]